MADVAPLRFQKIAHHTCGAGYLQFEPGWCRLCTRPTSRTARPLNPLFNYATPTRLSFPTFSFLSLSFPYTNLELKAGLRSIVVTTSHTDDPPSLAPPQKQLVLDAHPTTPLHSTSLGLGLGLAVFRHPSLPQPADSGTCDDLLIRSLYVWPSPEIALVSTLASGFPAAEQQQRQHGRQHEQHSPPDRRQSLPLARRDHARAIREIGHVLQGTWTEEGAEGGF
jgi:hypothetical protein